MTEKTLALAADHRGFVLKALLVETARAQGWTVHDLGTHSAERCDSQDYAVAMVAAMKGKKARLGVLICGSGNGIAIAANRFRALRVAVVHTSTGAQFARQHNDANVMALGADMIGKEVALACLTTFLQTDFLGGKYAERVAKLDSLGGL
jgi:ribose 5-phosphate isomerase B